MKVLYTFTLFEVKAQVTVETQRLLKYNAHAKINGGLLTRKKLGKNFHVFTVVQGSVKCGTYLMYAVPI